MPQKVADNIAADVIKEDYHLTTGNIATKYLPEVLSEIWLQRYSHAPYGADYLSELGIYAFYGRYYHLGKMGICHRLCDEFAFPSHVWQRHSVVL